MKLAIFADVHGNYQALEAILADIEREKVDQTICAGDAINPFAGSVQVWETLQALAIPMVRGNHEEYMLAYHAPATGPAMQTEVRFMPVQFTARRLSPPILAGIERLPLTLTIAGPGGDDLLVCHASPFHTRRSFWPAVDAAMAADLERVPFNTVVAGHMHEQWQTRWRDKHLVLTGTAGQPLDSRTMAQYLILTHRRGRGWQANHKTIPYDHAAAVRQTAQSGLLTEGGPLGWLFFEELRTADHLLVPFLTDFCPRPYPATLTDWQTITRRYLQMRGRWEALAAYLPL